MRWQQPEQNLIPAEHIGLLQDLKCHDPKLLLDECKNTNSTAEHEVIFWFMMNTVLLITNSFYIMFYAGVIERLGKIIQIIKSVLKELFYFLILFVFWNVMFAGLIQIAGQNIDAEDYKNLSEHSMFVISVFRNSIGDVQTPKTKIWDNHVNMPNGGLNHFSTQHGLVMIYYNWFLWALQLFFMPIIVLNLLIAIISELYDDVNKNINIYTYQQKSYLILESLMIKEFYSLFTNNRRWDEKAMVFHLHAETT